MSKSRGAGRKLQIISEPNEEMHQLDLLSFVSDYALADLSAKTKQVRTTLVKNNIAKAPGGISVSPASFRFHGHVDKNKTFESFCLGDSNQFAVEAIKRFIFCEKSDFGMIYLKAASGLGKTHILHAVANELFSHEKSFYLGSPLMMSSLIENFNGLKDYSYLLIDDLEEIEENVELQKVFCQLIDYAKTGKMKMILTGAVFPKDLLGPDDRFKGKLSAALIHNIAGITKKLAIDIVHAKSQSLGLSLSEQMKELISRKLEFNVYGLESTLLKLKSTSEIIATEISLEMVIEETKSKENPLRNEAYQSFLKEIANAFHVKVEDLISPIRRQELALARHVAMFILKEKAGLSIKRISDFFEKDHSSVIYAIARIKREIECDYKIRNKIQKLLDEGIAQINF